METKILLAQEAYELGTQMRTRILSCNEIMSAIKQRALSGFDYLMTFGRVSEETEKALIANGYRIKVFKDGCIQFYWHPR